MGSDILKISMSITWHLLVVLLGADASMDSDRCAWFFHSTGGEMQVNLGRFGLFE
jgi:hypothetical protein